MDYYKKLLLKILINSSVNIWYK